MILAKVASGFAGKVANLFLPKSVGSNLKKYAKPKGAYALVTGASDGIGKEFSFQLAKAGFNVILISRTKSKLDQVSTEISKKYPSTKNIVIPFDFASATPTDYTALKSQLNTLDISILVNNVAMCHAIPTPFLEEEAQLIDNMVEVNIRSLLLLSKIVMPQMVSRKNGLVLNIGSVSGTVPSAFISVYSASKAFLKSWSQAVAHEVKNKGVHVEHCNTYFVTTALSKIRKPSFLTPTPRAYVESVLATCGKHFEQTPYPSHSLVTWVLGFFSNSFLVSKSAEMHASIRKRALAKREREAGKKGK